MPDEATIRACGFDPATITPERRAVLKKQLAKHQGSTGGGPPTHAVLERKSRRCWCVRQTKRLPGEGTGRWRVQIAQSGSVLGWAVFPGDVAEVGPRALEALQEARMLFGKIEKVRPRPDA